jgi:penicillin amidase/acyl-homoserine-lactone acylase
MVFTGLATLVLIAVLALLGLDWPNRPQPVDLAGLIARGDRYDVQIRRDRWGVPHVLGQSNADAAFGLAFAHAEDDFATIQDVALATRGTLAGRLGLKAAAGDYIVNLLEVWQTVDAGYERDLPADLRAVLEAYADGINAYAARHPEAVEPGLLPMTGKDIAAGFVFKTPFFYGLDAELKRLNSLPPDHLPKGSNGVAVAPLRASDGATRLLVNSHQPFTGPVAWYEAVVESGEGWHVAGGFFPGSPFMLHGHNASLGWANTVNKPDLIDTYRLVLNPENSNQYRLDGKWRDFERQEAKLRIRLFGPFHWTVKRPVLRSVHGPVMETKAGAFALRYAGMGEARQPLQYWRLNLARNLDEWRAAMALQALPSINYIYADNAGNIGYVYNGLFPDRKVSGIDWSAVLPGDRSDLIWRSYLPFDRIPQIWNPRSGLVFNANNTPFQATAIGDGLNPEAFPASMGIQTDMTNRAWREMETFGEDRKISAEAFVRYKFDVTYSARSRVAEIVTEALRLDPGKDADLKAAQDLLRRWDRRATLDNRSAALAILTAWSIEREPEDGKQRPTVSTALTQTIHLLKSTHGRIDPAWGEVNRLRRGSVDLPVDGGPDTLRAIYGEPDSSGRLTAVAGDTLAPCPARACISLARRPGTNDPVTMPIRPRSLQLIASSLSCLLKPSWRDRLLNPTGREAGAPDARSGLHCDVTGLGCLKTDATGWVDYGQSA